MIKQLLLSLPLLALVACGGDKKENTDNSGGNAAAKKEGDNHNMSEHGEAQSLGEINVMDRTVKVVQLGKIEAGKEGAVELQFGTSDQRISTVRAWIGIESGIGSMKGKMEIEGDTGMHGHIEVPDPIPANSKLWLTFEADGDKKTVSVAYK